LFFDATLTSEGLAHDSGKGVVILLGSGHAQPGEIKTAAANVIGRDPGTRQGPIRQELRPIGEEKAAVGAHGGALAVGEGHLAVGVADRAVRQVHTRPQAPL